MPLLRHMMSLILAGSLLAPNASAGGQLEIWPDVGRAADGWDFVDEAQTDPDNDPDLRRWGVRSRRVRYYSRLHDGRIESCSVEIWRFKDLQGAEAAERGFGYPDWRVEREGDALLMLHGQALQRGRPAERGVGPDCARIGRAIRSNIHLR